jgi:aryl-alcohol dehydrogenase-like predicted oxidoreductase
MNRSKIKNNRWRINMKYRALGKTGLEVSEVVFGGGAVGGLLIRQEEDVKRRAVERALAAGINWIDTAPMYGQGESEKAIGWLLKEIEEERRPHVATKAMIDVEAGDLSGQVERILSESLERLQMSSVDLLQIHNRVVAQAGEGNALGVAEMLGDVRKGLERVRAGGMVRHVGFTANGDKEALHEVIGAGFYESVQAYYNMINPSAGRDLPAQWSGHDFGNLIGQCKEKGVGVLVIRVLAAGVLATDVRHGREGEIIPGADVESNERQAARLLAAIGEGQGTRAQMAVRYGLSNAGVSGVVVGMAELEHLEQALGAVDMGPLSEDMLARLHAIVDSNFAE